VSTVWGAIFVPFLLMWGWVSGLVTSRNIQNEDRLKLLHCAKCGLTIGMMTNWNHPGETETCFCRKCAATL